MIINYSSVAMEGVLEMFELILWKNPTNTMEMEESQTTRLENVILNVINKVSMNNHCHDPALKSLTFVNVGLVNIKSSIFWKKE